jgi:PPM family protein phosphatase
LRFQVAYHTDIGIRKKTNQDGLLLKTAVTPKGEVGLFAVCDGMGGLADGEQASATVVRGMAEWFDEELPAILQSETWTEELHSSLNASIIALNEKLYTHGEWKQAQLGTTITALLVIFSKSYILQIGDSRAYHISRTGTTQLTKDQTLVAREVERGNLTEEQAKKDPRRNILLQCVGATKDLDVVISSGEAEAGSYLLCTDGFYHKISEQEIQQKLQPDRFASEAQMTKTLTELIELAKSRQEIDNISAILVKVG